MANNEIESVTIEYEEEGKQIVKVLEKQVLTAGAWATVAFLYQELNRQTEQYSEPKMRLVRYRKVNGKYLPQGKFNISSAKQAITIADTINKWFADSES
jgi:hypothetical protein